MPSLSILDGWWIEGYNGKNGWAFGSKDGNDASDSGAVYELLEEDIIPLYYDTDEQGVPRGWVKMMKAAMKSVGPNFSARRMVKEYMEKFYKPAMRSAAGAKSL